MSADTPSPSADEVTFAVELSAAEWELRTKLTVPAGPTRLRQLLPLVQSFADAVVEGAAKGAEEQGLKISCKKGCGACCRQAVPISEVEARRIRDVVNELPEPRRSQVRARFAEARRRLAEAGLLDDLLHPGDWALRGNASFSLKYFYLGIPCPFLEEESCSIYADRPLTCREYLVTTPAENCARLGPESEIGRLKMPFRVWTALARTGRESPPGDTIPWVPLIVAPEWADAHPDERAPQSGQELLRGLFEELTGRDLTRPPPALDPASGSAPPLKGE